ncbi:ribosomal protection-like ABC-F family protein [Metabacillus sp. JX24]|uniref:ribosomal protection-like ABC-F family protein n=1 Tax=Metabacillus sp. JX24 TaxID=3240759 RepID=UPI003510A539
MAKNSRNEKAIVKINGLTKNFGDKLVFEDVSFDIREGDRAGLAGYNGTGKTTLANLLFGTMEPDKGSLTRKAGLKIGYLLQSVDYSVQNFKDALSSEGDQTVLEAAGRLGLEKVADWEEDRLLHLSGGEKLKLALAQVISTNPDLLILDEPTNHLDYHGIEWLADWLQTFRGAVLIISHDRHFLDRTVSHIFELENKKLKEYKGNYTAYRQEKKRQLEEQKHDFEMQQRHKAKIEGQMENLRSWSEKAHRNSTKQGSLSERRQMGFKEYHRAKAKKMDVQVRSKMKRLEAELEKNKIEKPLEDTAVQFEFDAAGKRGKRIFEAKGLQKSFAGRTLISSSHFYMKHGERIGVIGRNGAGKTTLIRMLQGIEGLSGGELWRSPTLKIACLSQDVGDLNADESVLEAMQAADRDKSLKARTLLANMGLKEDKIEQKIGCLSLGERTRVKLAGLILNEYDCLILDEPTNHLDLPSREQLEETLSQFKGTLIIISHDRYLVEKLCDKLLVFENGRIRRAEMRIGEYYSALKNENTVPNDDEEELLKVNNRLTAVIGKLSLINRDHPEFQEYDNEFARLIREKNLLEKRKKG